VDLWPEANREDNVFGSKAVGEPPFMLAISVYEALRDAVAAGCAERGADGRYGWSWWVVPALTNPQCNGEVPSKVRPDAYD
jgi:hypothetical protein